MTLPVDTTTQLATSFQTLSIYNFFEPISKQCLDQLNIPEYIKRISSQSSELSLSSPVITGEELFKVLGVEYLKKHINKIDSTEQAKRQLLDEASKPIESLSIVFTINDRTSKDRKQFVQEIKAAIDPLGTIFHFDGEGTHLSGFTMATIEMPELKVVFKTQSRHHFFAHADAGYITYENCNTLTVAAHGCEKQWLTDIANKCITIPDAATKSPAKNLINYMMKGFSPTEDAHLVLENECFAISSRKNLEMLFNELQHKWHGRTVELAWVLYTLANRCKSEYETQTTSFVTKVLLPLIKSNPTACCKPLFENNREIHLKNAEKLLTSDPVTGYSYLIFLITIQDSRSSVLEQLLYKNLYLCNKTPELKPHVQKALALYGMHVDDPSESTVIKALLATRNPLGTALLLQSKDAELKKEWIPYFLQYDVNTAISLIIRVKKTAKDNDVQNWLTSATQPSLVVSGLINQGFESQCLRYNPTTVYDVCHPVSDALAEKILLECANKAKKVGVSDEMVELVRRCNTQVLLTSKNAQMLSVLFLDVRVAAICPSKTIEILQLNATANPKRELFSYFVKADNAIGVILSAQRVFKENISGEDAKAVVKAFSHSITNASRPSADSLRWYLSMTATIFQDADPKEAIQVFIHAYTQAPECITKAHPSHLKAQLAALSTTDLQTIRETIRAQLPICKAKAPKSTPSFDALFKQFFVLRQDEIVSQAKQANSTEEAKNAIESLLSLQKPDPDEQVVGLLIKFFSNNAVFFNQIAETCKKKLSNSSYHNFIHTLVSEKEKLSNDVAKKIWPPIFSNTTLLHNPKMIALLEHPIYFTRFVHGSLGVSALMHHCKQNSHSTPRLYSYAFSWHKCIDSQDPQKAQLGVTLACALFSAGLSDCQPFLEQACLLLAQGGKDIQAFDDAVLPKFALAVNAHTLNPNQIRAFCNVLIAMEPYLSRQKALLLLISFQCHPNVHVRRALLPALHFILKENRLPSIGDHLQQAGFPELVLSLLDENPCEKDSLETKAELFRLEFLNNSQELLQNNSKTIYALDTPLPPSTQLYIQTVGNHYIKFLQDVLASKNPELAHKALLLDCAITYIPKECSTYFRSGNTHIELLAKLFILYLSKEGITPALLQVATALIESITLPLLIKQTYNPTNIDLSSIDTERYVRRILPTTGDSSFQTDKTTLVFTPEIVKTFSELLPSEMAYLTFTHTLIEESIAYIKKEECPPEKDNLLRDTVLQYLLVLLECYTAHEKTLTLLQAFGEAIGTTNNLLSKDKAILKMLLHKAKSQAKMPSGTQENLGTLINIQNLVIESKKNEDFYRAIQQLFTWLSTDFTSAYDDVDSTFQSIFDKLKNCPKLLQSEVIRKSIERLFIPLTKMIMVKQNPAWGDKICYEYVKTLLDIFKDKTSAGNPDPEYLAIAIKFLQSARAGCVFDTNLDRFKELASEIGTLLLNHRNLLDDSFFKEYNGLICSPIRIKSQNNIEYAHRENLVLYWLKIMPKEHMEHLLQLFFSYGGAFKNPTRHKLDALYCALTTRNDTPVEPFLRVTDAVINCASIDSQVVQRDALFRHWLELVLCHSGQNPAIIDKVLEMAVLKHGYLKRLTHTLITHIGQMLIEAKASAKLFLLHAKGLQALTDLNSKTTIFCDWIVEIGAKITDKSILKIVFECLLDSKILTYLKVEQQSVVQEVHSVFQKLTKSDQQSVSRLYLEQITPLRSL